jgi:predicted metalloendopeptidase
MKLSHYLLATALLASGGALCALETGIDLSNADKNVRVQDDLYLAINGSWLAKTEIPADRSNYGAFTALDDLSRDRIRAIIEEAAKGPHAKGSDAQKVGDLYLSFMDEKAIESLGTKPIQPELAKIAAISSQSELALSMGKLSQLGVQVPVAFFVGQDDKDSSAYIATYYQSGLGMPDRDYYLKKEPKFEEAKTAYLRYIETMLTLVGDKKEEAAKAAVSILDFETKLAAAQWPKVELRDPEKNYNKMPFSKLAELAPGFDWSAYLTGLDARNVADVIVGQPSFVKQAASLMQTTPMPVLKDYLRFKLLEAYSIALPAAFQKASFEFHEKTLAGIPEDKPRWKKAVSLIGGEGDFGVLGDVVGRLYVEKYFPAEAKARMDQLVKNLLEAYRRSISNLAWMTPETKVKALEKLAKYTTKIGYPEQWRDYSSLQIEKDKLMGNLQASAVVEHHRNIDKLGKPVDRKEWGMTPQTVNAYYNPGMNEIVFPAAILQPPFFNQAADDAVNYGAIGAVIGHEISHGFDDQGSQYDGEGNLRSWWSDSDRNAFKELTQRLVAQYSAYEVQPGKAVNGELTLGENIADLSGLSIAFKAYSISLGGKPSPVIEGYTGEQRFFIGWSQVWRRKFREAEMLKRLLTDPHSPSQFRANGPVSNNDAFYKAFDLKPGDKLYKPEDQRIRIW